MKNEYLDFLTELYIDSSALVGIYDMKFVSVYKNKALKKHDKNSEYDRLDLLLDKTPDKNGLYYFKNSKDFCTLNVIIMADKGYIIAEQIHNENISDVFAVPVVDDYLTYIFSKIRETVNTVSISIDEIYNDIIKNKSEGNNNSVDYLNTIDDCTLELLNEIIDPEILLNLAKNNNNDKTICVSDILESLADETEHMLGKDIKIYKDIESGIYARINKSYFDVIIADITDNLISSEGLPESLIFSVKRVENNILRLTVQAEGIRTDGNNKNDKLKDIMFYSYICDTFCKKYKGEFTKLSSNESTAYRIDMQAISPAELTVSSSFGYTPPISRFSPMSLRLKTYKKAKKFDTKWVKERKVEREMRNYKKMCAGILAVMVSVSLLAGCDKNKDNDAATTTADSNVTTVDTAGTERTGSYTESTRGVAEGDVHAIYKISGQLPSEYWSAYTDDYMEAFLDGNSKIEVHAANYKEDFTDLASYADTACANMKYQNMFLACDTNFGEPQKTTVAGFDAVYYDYEIIANEFDENKEKVPVTNHKARITFFYSDKDAYYIITQCLAEDWSSYLPKFEAYLGTIVIDENAKEPEKTNNGADSGTLEHSDDNSQGGIVGVDGADSDVSNMAE